MTEKSKLPADLKKELEAVKKKSDSLLTDITQEDLLPFHQFEESVQQALIFRADIEEKEVKDKENEGKKKLMRLVHIIDEEGNETVHGAAVLVSTIVKRKIREPEAKYFICKVTLKGKVGIDGTDKEYNDFQILHGKTIA